VYRDLHQPKLVFRFHNPHRSCRAVRGWLKRNLATFCESVKPRRSIAKQHYVLGNVENFFALVKKYHAKLTYGTDLVIGSDTSLQTKELVMRSKWFTPYEILVQATSRAGELIALAGPRNPYPGKLGVIEEGAYADMLLVHGNPLENIELVGQPETSFVLIMKDGTIYKNIIG
jgi:imidazolonepropionase-like amidohydrolase